MTSGPLNGARSSGYVAGWDGGEDAITRIRESGHSVQQAGQQAIAELGLEGQAAP